MAKTLIQGTLDQLKKKKLDRRSTVGRQPIIKVSGKQKEVLPDENIKMGLSHVTRNLVATEQIYKSRSNRP